MYKLTESSRIQNIEDRFKCSIKKILYNWHWEKNLKHSEIGEKISIPRSTITKWFKCFNIPTQSCTRFTNLNLLNVGPRKTPPAKQKIKKEKPWKVNEEFFKKWTPEMAYVLGFFTADGSMTKNRRGAHFIEIQITDKELLEEIRETLGSNHKITEIKRNERNVRWKNIYRLQIGSKEIFNDLLKLGLTPAKSKTIDLPLIPNKYFPHFVRGYFDGDGNVVSGYFNRCDRKSKAYTLSTRFTSGSELILNNLKKNLTKLIGTTGSIHNKENTWRLNYSINDSKKLFRFMYNDNRIDGLIYLKRKYKIYRNAGVA